MAYLGNFVIGMCGAAGIGKLRAFPIQMILTHVKSDFATYASHFLIVSRPGDLLFLRFAISVLMPSSWMSMSWQGCETIKVFILTEFLVEIQV